MAFRRAAAHVGFCFVMISLVTIGLAEGASAQECKDFGTPSYTATRNVDIGGNKITAKVSISGENEREDVKGGDRIVTTLRMGRSVTVYDNVSKTGRSFQIQVPSAPPKLDEANQRKFIEKDGDTQTNTIQVKDGENWIDLIKVVCRSDGVLLAREFPVDLQGKPGRVKLRHSDIEVKPLPAETFVVPKGFKIDAK